MPQKKRKYNPFKFVIIKPQVKYIKMHLQPCIDFASAVAGAPNWKDTRVSCQVLGCMLLWRARLLDCTYEIMHMMVAACGSSTACVHSQICPPSRPGSSMNGVEADTNRDQGRRGARAARRERALLPSEDEKADTGSDFELEEPAKSARSPRGMRSPRKEQSLPAAVRVPAVPGRNATAPTATLPARTTPL